MNRIPRVGPRPGADLVNDPVRFPLVFHVLVLRGDAEDFKIVTYFALVDPSGALYYLFADR